MENDQLKSPAFAPADLDHLLEQRYNLRFEHRVKMFREDYGQIIHHLQENGYSVIPKESHWTDLDGNNPLITELNGNVLGEIVLHKKGRIMSVYYTPKIKEFEEANQKLSLVIDNFIRE